MATFWVDQSQPDDTGDGLTFATAKKTLAAGYALLTNKGDILNLVNSGQYPWPTADLEVSADPGTSFTDFGYLIRGVTGASETPGYATIATDTGDANAIRRVFRINSGGGFLILRNLIFDDTEKAADTNIHTVVRYNSPGGPVWFDGCAFLAGASGVAHAGTHQFLNVQSGTVDGTRIWDCYFQNMQTAMHGVTGGASSISIIGNLVYLDAPGAAITLMTRSLGGGGTGDTFDLTYNTFYYSIGNNTVSPVLSYAMGGAADAGPVSIHSNLYFVESSNTNPNIEFITDTGGPLPFTGGTVGFNVLLGGPNVVVGDLNADGWYVGDTFDVGADPKATDQVAYQQAEATIFNAPASTFAWDALDNGATITILKDLRPRLFLTAGFGSTVPGALPAAETDLSVEVTADIVAPFPDDVVTLTVTAANDGTDAASVVYTAAIPAGLTFVSAVPSAGSYNSGTGVWTIGSLADSTAETLAITVTVDTDQGGNDIDFTASVTSADPANDPDASNDTDTLTLAVQVEDDGDPGTVPYLDVAPIFAPVLRGEINASIFTKRNRIRHNEVRQDYERTWREYTSRRLSLGSGATATVISGIERGAFIIMESTDDVRMSLSLGDTDHYLPAAERVAVLAGDFSVIKLNNPGSAAVDVLLVVID